LSIFIEVKGRKGQLTQSQREIRDRLEEAGAFWALCRSVDQVQEFLEELIKLRGR
jgi:predicted Holliday junction resolvase-like endonuclease